MPQLMILLIPTSTGLIAAAPVTVRGCREVLMVPVMELFEAFLLWTSVEELFVKMSGGIDT